MTAGDGHDDAGELHDQLHPLLHHVPAVPYHLQVNIIDNIYGLPTNIEENTIIFARLLHYCIIAILHWLT